MLLIFSSLATGKTPLLNDPLKLDSEIHFSSEEARKAHQTIISEISSANAKELKKILEKIEIEYRSLPPTTKISDQKLMLARKIEKLKFTIEIAENLKKVQNGQLKLLSVRTNQEANKIHPFAMFRTGGTDPYPTSNQIPVYTFETLDNSTEAVFLQQKPDVTKTSEIQVTGSYSTPPTQKSSTVFVTGDQQRDLTASRPNSKDPVKQIFVRASYETGTVFQVGTIGAQLDGKFTGSGGNIQYVSQRQNEKLLQAYERSNPEAKEIYETYFKELAERRRSSSKPDSLLEAEKKLREHIQQNQSDYTGVLEEAKPEIKKIPIRYQDAIESKNPALLEIQQKLSSYADEKNLDIAIQKELEIKEKIKGIARANLSTQEREDFKKIVSNYSQYVDEKAQKNPNYQTSRTATQSRESSLETNHKSSPQESLADKAAGRIGCLQTAAESQGIISKGGRLSPANIAALAACGFDEAAFRAYAKGGISNLGRFTSGASTAIGGGLSLLAYYQGAEGSVEELQKVDYEKFKAAVNGKNPELLKEAFKDVNKLNLASSATMATEGALGFAASAGALLGAPTVATIGAAGGLVLALPAGILYSYKRGEDINNQYKNDLSQLDAYEKNYTDNLRNLSLFRNSSRLREFRFNKLDQFSENLCKQNIETIESKKITQEPEGAAGKTCQTRLETITHSYSEGKFQDSAAKAPSSIGFDFCKEGAAALKNVQNNPKALQQAYINFLGCREASRAASKFIQNQIYFMPGKNTKNSFVPRSIAGIVLFTDKNDYNESKKSYVQTKQDLKHTGPSFIYLSEDSDSKRNFLEEKKNTETYLQLNKNEAGSLSALMKSKQVNNQPQSASYCSQVYSKLEAIDIEIEGLKTACTLAVTEIEARITADQKQEVDQLFTQQGIKKEGVGGLYSQATDKTSSDAPRH